MMKVLGHEIPERAERAIEFMGAEFTAVQVDGFMIRNGVKSGEVSMRAADRVIQKARRAGLIRFTGNKWMKLSPTQDGGRNG